MHLNYQELQLSEDLKNTIKFLLLKISYLENTDGIKNNVTKDDIIQQFINIVLEDDEISRNFLVYQKQEPPIINK